MTKHADNEAFVRAVQQALGLTVDGWAGNRTVAAWRASLGPAGAILTPSKAAMDLMHQFEGCRLTAYPDPGSKDGHPWTIGWGSTGPGIAQGVVWTQQQADDRFAADVASFAAKVRDALGDVPTTQNQFDAMVSLAYNIGAGAFASSTLLKKHKAGDYTGAQAQFARWSLNDGRPLAGLARRRAAEAALYGGRS